MWRHELETQSQGVGQNANAARRRLLILKSKAKEKLSTMYNVQAEYLVEVFKYPRTGDRIPPDAPDGYGSTPMIGLYSLVDPYSITRITTTQSGLTTEDREKKSTSKCFCSLCDYVVQNRPSINNHFCTHLGLSLLCTIQGCFHIEHGCNNMWTHVTREHGIPSAHAVVPPSKRSKKKKRVAFRMPIGFGVQCLLHLPGGCFLVSSIPILMQSAGFLRCRAVYVLHFALGGVIP